MKFDVDRSGNILYISAHRSVSNQVDMANRLIDSLISKSINRLCLHGLGDAVGHCIEVAQHLMAMGKLTLEG